MAVIIRHAGPGDEPAVVELIQELAVTFDYPTTCLLYTSPSPRD